MSNFFVIGFDEPHKAEEVSLKLQELQSEYLLDLEEVVVAVKDEKGKVKLHQAGSLLTADDAVFGGFCGSLTALIFLNATMGAASGALAEVGITRHFMKELAGTLIPGGSALFVLVRRPVAGQGEGAERNRRQNLEDLGFARGRGQTAGCFECGEIVRSCLRRLPFKDDETLARILHVTGDDRLGTTAIYLNLIDMHVVDEYTQRW
jgi:uncharacterized membrane protein